MAKKSDKKEHPRRRSAAILDAAAEVFATRGFHGASTQDIADVLGIKQASLYYYFPSKEVALEEVCLRGAEGHLETAISIASAPDAARDKVRRLIAAHLASLLDRRPYVRTFLNERQHLPTESRRRIGRLSRAYERLIEDVLTSGVRGGEFRHDLDCRLAALGLLGLINAVAAWYGKEPKATLDRIVAEYARLYLGGVGAKGSTERRTKRSLKS
ncbi:MAG TPA: TetR/AcrR family transcriptional regulator [Xanthobacteraceae bacterium]|nr:TetR/AcrR family transcriptional regulator [Xanthobacteraceae bacterium]